MLNASNYSAIIETLLIFIDLRAQTAQIRIICVVWRSLESFHPSPRINIRPSPSALFPTESGV